MVEKRFGDLWEGVFCLHLPATCRILFATMHTFFRHNRAVAVLVVYLLGGGLMEVSHSDVAWVMFGSQPTVATHGCGDHEKHIPADQARHCLACSPFAQQSAVGTIQVFGLDPTTVCHTLHAAPSSSTSEPDVISSGKRGPPCV